MYEKKSIRKKALWKPVKRLVELAEHSPRINEASGNSGLEAKGRERTTGPNTEIKDIGGV